LLAVRFAAKEAFTKALKTGLKEGIRLRDIEMLHRETGEPYLVLRGEAEKRVRELGIRNIHVSVSHEREYSVGVVILEK
ncbi:MAG: holo-ACP synthase, partial [Desulfatiglandales bacterium]